ncbi:hypothetical protein RJ641_001297, partial [Dillenia turbinata]
MSRGESHGGGQSSLGYLFGSDQPPSAPPVSPTVTLPPYGTDASIDQPQHPSPTSQKSNNYPRAQGQNAGNFITDRPSTRVKSVPGGDSSLGYLFGD